MGKLIFDYEDYNITPFEKEETDTVADTLLFGIISPFFFLPKKFSLSILVHSVSFIFITFIKINSFSFLLFKIKQKEYK